MVKSGHKLQNMCAARLIGNASDTKEDLFGNIKTIIHVPIGL